MASPVKTVAVFGANGRVGSLVVERLVSKGYTVRAFVHGAPKVTLPTVTYIQGDVADKAQVAEALAGADAVISALGSWGTKDKNVLSTAMERIIPTMQRLGISRIVSLTGVDAQVPEKHSLVSRLSHFAFSIVAKKIIQDGEAHIALLAASALSWTVVRSPVMNKKGNGAYALNETYPMPWQSVHRHAVAQAMVDQLEAANFHRKAPYIHRA
jgi:uncharacterized protein